MLDIMDLHTHTIASGHAYNTIYEMARSASERKIELLGITDHGPKAPGTSSKSYFNNFKMVPRHLYGIRLMLGCELNILDHRGNVDLEQAVLEKQDFTIASMHSHCYEGGTVVQNTEAYLNVMKNPYVQIIGHPDDNRFPIDYETFVCAAKENHILLEVNNNSLNPRCIRQGAIQNYRIMLEYCKKYQVSVILDSDAHCEVDVANHSLAKKLIQEVSFPEKLIVNRSINAAAEFIPYLKK